ncbi:hypothetical protein BR93DRAFT_967379 [Coniochaeta sp. PMI_546]|nr:hypothetical protein BR93DRAFT_967379 [Coniochaeta sp. PMI_546]
MDLPRLTLPQASAVTAVSLLNTLLALTSSLERTFVAKRQHNDSAFTSISSLMWQHPRTFCCLWLARGGLGIVACLLTLSAMWVELALEQENGRPGFAAIWAAGALVACITGSIVAERLLYLGFTDSLNFEQIACTVMSLTGVALVIVGELVTGVPVRIA